MKIYRKRYIPNEIVDISSDKLDKINDKIIKTSWVPIKPREDIDRGESWYNLLDGYKISKMYKTNNLVYYYCDIVSLKISDEDYIFTDLLVDLVIYPDMSIKVLDMDELIELYNDKVINKTILLEAITKLDNLIKLVTDIGIENIIKKIEES